MSQLCRATKSQPIFRVYTDKVSVDRCKRGEMVHWTAMTDINGVAIATGLPKLEHVHKQYPTGDAKTWEYEFKLNQFRVQKVAYNKGRFVTREQSLRYLADKMGGTHPHQVGRKARQNDISDILDLHGATFFPKSNNWQLMNGMDPTLVAEYENRGGLVFSMLHLIALDSARRFCQGDFRPLGMNIYHENDRSAQIPPLPA